MFSISLHPLLQHYHQDTIGSPSSSILWDLREPPSTSARLVSRPTKLISPSQLAQFATSPPVPFIRVTCDLFPCPWPIEAYNPNGVTVLDVLGAIHYASQERISHFEWQSISEKQRERVGQVFHQRWNASEFPMQVRASGVIRADCLLQSTCFAGLSTTPEMGSEFILSLTRDRTSGRSSESMCTVV